MKLCFWYVLRDILRRPRRALSMVAVNASVMAVMILMTLWLEAEWRDSVMPLSEWNTHFSFYNLTEADKRYIREQDWCRIAYDTYHRSSDEVYQNQFRVRVTWEHNGDSTALAARVMLDRGLYNREPYASRYQREYQNQYAKIVDSWLGMTEKNGLRAEDMAARNARSFIIRSMVENYSYTMQVQNGYVMQPSFFTFLSMLGLFLGAAITILQMEAYRASFSDFGTLRALGMTKIKLWLTNLVQAGCSAVAAVPLAILLTLGAVQVYYALVEPFRETAGEVYFTITHYVPLAVLAGLTMYLLGAALAGASVVAYVYRKKGILSLLRQEGTFTVSFVSKTSPAFERSEGVAEYSRLYVVRARRSLIRYTAVIAMMLPLPMLFLMMSLTYLDDLAHPAMVVEGIYQLFQTVTVSITALCVSGAASRMEARGRAGEFAILRSLGADRSTIRRIAYPTATAQCLLMLGMSLLAFALVSGVFSTGNYIDSTEGARSLGEIVGVSLLYMLGSAIFALPSAYSGLSVFLFGFFRRPVMVTLRERE